MSARNSLENKRLRRAARAARHENAPVSTHIDTELSFYTPKSKGKIPQRCLDKRARRLNRDMILVAKGGMLLKGVRR